MANIIVFVCGIRVQATSVQGAKAITQAKLALAEATRAGADNIALKIDLSEALLDHGVGITLLGSIKASNLVVHHTRQTAGLNQTQVKSDPLKGLDPDLCLGDLVGLDLKTA